mmetsp:Transcript_74590/g.172795  ORF Transcript_74590/g.172795 Transcript_74590/m.172795 type:complete len:116 (-) Transcript_74590:52-399(-)
MLTLLSASGSNSVDDACRQRSCETVRLYADATRRVVEARVQSGTPNLVFIDLYDAMLGDSGWRRFLRDDGVHLSQDGSQFLFARLCSALKAAEGEVEGLPRQSPHFFDVIAAFGS